MRRKFSIYSSNTEEVRRFFSRRTYFFQQIMEKKVLFPHNLLI